IGGAASENAPPVSALMMAAPVGVVVSRGSSTQRTREPLRTSSVAGPGEGRGPWAEPTTPLPSGSGPQLTVSAPRSSSATQLPTTSTMESTAPTSWKVTCSGSWLCTAPSATARRRKASRARAEARSGSPAPATRSRTSPKVRWACCSGWVTVALSAPTPLTSTRSVARSKATPRPRSAAVISCSGAPAATRLARVMSPAAPPTGWKWTWVKRPAPGSGATLLLAPVGDLARRHEGGGEGDGEQDHGPRVAPYGVGEGRRVALPADLAYRVGLALRGVDEAPARAGEGALDPVPYLRADLLADDLGVDVLAEVLNVRDHAAPDLEHLPLYALRCLAHDLNCPFNQLMFCWSVLIVRCGTGSSLRSMLAPDPASIPPIKSSTPETISAESHRLSRKRLSTYTPVKEMKMRKTSRNTAPTTRRPVAMPACLPTGTSSVRASSTCLSTSSWSWGLRASTISLTLRSEGSGPSLSSLPNSTTRSRPSISHAPFDPCERLLLPA